jgi:hypothetical protein
MVALSTVFYNWTKIHKTLRTTPAMAAGLTERVWDMADIVALIERAEAPVPALNVSASHSADCDTTIGCPRLSTPADQFCPP